MHESRTGKKFEALLTMDHNIFPITEMPFPPQLDPLPVQLGMVIASNVPGTKLPMAQQRNLLKMWYPSHRSTLVPDLCVLLRTATGILACRNERLPGLIILVVIFGMSMDSVSPPERGSESGLVWRTSNLQLQITSTGKRCGSSLLLYPVQHWEVLIDHHIVMFNITLREGSYWFSNYPFPTFKALGVFGCMGRVYEVFYFLLTEFNDLWPILQISLYFVGSSLVAWIRSKNCKVWECHVFRSSVT